MIGKRYILLPVCSLTIFIIVVLGFNNILVPLDMEIIKIVQSLETPILTKILALLTNISDTIQNIIITTVIVIVLYLKKYKQEALYLTISMLTCSLLVMGIKNFIQRPRPQIHRLAEISGYSFPSGHTVSATILYFSMALIIVKIYQQLTKQVTLTIATIGIIFIIFSRIYLGVHYPTDTIAGAALGITVVVFYYWVFYKSPLYKYGEK
ncbi:MULTISPECIES: phosphatase PAP2 family protein [Gemella]|uniref:phosphatase PAP2 family protein n=1 Tax=Gemella TaxID=1378 RepID=UPI00076845D8|nr:MULTISPECIES: phosphatase PAP2 family protein [Gemella]AME09190.1 hypothetical protein AXE85_02955 [Gemella sp. oral taxon 928]AXI26823.1 phosphatase PAP2 family protein [Gemella sp. ND 6198]